MKSFAQYDLRPSGRRLKHVAEESMHLGLHIGAPPPRQGAPITLIKWPQSPKNYCNTGAQHLKRALGPGYPWNSAPQELIYLQNGGIRAGRPVIP